MSLPSNTVEYNLPLPLPRTFHIRKAVGLIRAFIACCMNVDLKRMFSPQPTDFSGYCGWAQSLTYYALLKMNIPPQNIFAPNAGDVWGNGSHAFIVLVDFRTRQKSPVYYILDFTLAQFFHNTDQGIPKRSFKNLHRGYFRVNQKNLSQYAEITSIMSQKQNEVVPFAHVFRNVDMVTWCLPRLLDPATRDRIDHTMEDLRAEMTRCNAEYNLLSLVHLQR